MHVVPYAFVCWSFVGRLLTACQLTVYLKMYFQVAFSLALLLSLLKFPINCMRRGEARKGSKETYHISLENATVQRYGKVLVGEMNQQNISLEYTEDTSDRKHLFISCQFHGAQT